MNADDSAPVSRRGFIRAATGAAAAGAAAGTAAGQDGNESGGNESEGDGGGGGGTETVIVGPGGELIFDPAELQIEPGSTVVFDWDSPGHNVVPEDQPDESDWEGHEPLEGPGFTLEHVFEVEGTYEYVCTPHEGQGMVGTVQVGGDAGGEGGAEPADPEEMGVPIHPHFVGIATILAVMVSLMFTFFVLKYGESPHASGGNR